MKRTDLFQGLPGETLVRKGLADFESGQCTVPACLVAIARSRLIDAGLIAPGNPGTITEPERQLYRLLRKSDGDAYSKYNALLRELVSFEQALDHRLTRLGVKAPVIT
jgi:hypothetical protein